MKKRITELNSLWSNGKIKDGILWIPLTKHQAKALLKEWKKVDYKTQEILSEKKTNVFRSRYPLIRDLMCYIRENCGRLKE